MDKGIGSYREKYTSMSASGHAITYTKGITALTAHPTISKSTDTTSAPGALSHVRRLSSLGRSTLSFFCRFQVNKKPCGCK